MRHRPARPHRLSLRHPADPFGGRIRFGQCLQILLQTDHAAAERLFSVHESRPHPLQLGFECLHPHFRSLPPRFQHRPHRRHPPPPRHLGQQQAETPATAAISCLTSENHTRGSDRERPLIRPRDRHGRVPQLRDASRASRQTHPLRSHSGRRPRRRPSRPHAGMTARDALRPPIAHPGGWCGRPGAVYCRRGDAVEFLGSTGRRSRDATGDAQSNTSPPWPPLVRPYPRHPWLGDASSGRVLGCGWCYAVGTGEQQGWLSVTARSRGCEEDPCVVIGEGGVRAWKILLKPIRAGPLESVDKCGTAGRAISRR